MINIINLAPNPSFHKKYIQGESFRNRILMYKEFTKNMFNMIYKGSCMSFFSFYSQEVYEATQCHVHEDLN